MLKRLLCLITAPILMITLAATPASADVPPNFHWDSDNHIFCPLPWVDTIYGPGSMCTELRGFHGGAGWRSPFSTDRPPWIDTFRIVNGLWCTLANVRGADGVVGFVSTWGLLDMGEFGGLRPGMQYAYYGFQAIGRPGNYKQGDNTFYPAGDWLYVSGNVPIPDVARGCS